MPAFAYTSAKRAERPLSGAELRDWKRRYKSEHLDVVESMAATAIWEASNVFFAIVGVRRPAEAQVKLLRKLNEPALDDSPYRPAAVTRSLNLDMDIANALGSAAASETYASIIWADFEPAERVSYGIAAAWEADPEQADLIGQGLTAWRAGANWPAEWNPLSALRYSIGLPCFAGWIERGLLTR